MSDAAPPSTSPLPSDAPHLGAAPHGTEPAPLVVDTRGMHCPIPVIELAKVVEGAERGALVEVWSDDPSSRVDIPVWVRLKRHELVGTRELDPGVQAYLVRTTG